LNHFQQFKTTLSVNAVFLMENTQAFHQRLFSKNGNNQKEVKNTSRSGCCFNIKQNRMTGMNYPQRNIRGYLSVIPTSIVGKM